MQVALSIYFLFKILGTRYCLNLLSAIHVLSVSLVLFRVQSWWLWLLPYQATFLHGSILCKSRRWKRLVLENLNVYFYLFIKERCSCTKHYWWWVACIYCTLSDINQYHSNQCDPNGQTFRLGAEDERTDRPKAGGGIEARPGVEILAESQWVPEVCFLLLPLSEDEPDLAKLLGSVFSDHLYLLCSCTSNCFLWLPKLKLVSCRLLCWRENSPVRWNIYYS